MKENDYWYFLEEILEMDPRLYFLISRSFYRLEELPEKYRRRYMERLERLVSEFARGRLSRREALYRLKGLLGAISRVSCKGAVR